MASEEKIPVMFRVWDKKHGGGIIAIFPTTGDMYEHVGQHGSGNVAGVIASSRPATPAEYGPLKRELEGAPYHYKAEVYTRQAQWMRSARRGL